MNRRYIKIRSAQKRTPLHLVKLLQSVGSFSFSQSLLRTMFYGETDHDAGHQSRKEHREQRGGVHGHHNRTQALPPSASSVCFFFSFSLRQNSFYFEINIIKYTFLHNNEKCHVNFHGSGVCHVSRHVGSFGW